MQAGKPTLGEHDLEPGRLLPHVHTLTRTAVVDRLRAAVPSIGGRAHTESRKLDDFQSHDLPAAVVIIRGAPSSDFVGATRPRRVRRNIVVDIELVAAVAGAKGIEETLDDMSVEVERALELPDFLPFTASEWKNTTSQPGFAEGGDGALGILTLSYALSVASTEGRPDTHR